MYDGDRQLNLGFFISEKNILQAPTRRVGGKVAMGKWERSFLHSDVTATTTGFEQMLFAMHKNRLTDNLPTLQRKCTHQTAMRKLLLTCKLKFPHTHDLSRWHPFTHPAQLMPGSKVQNKQGRMHPFTHLAQRMQGGKVQARCNTNGAAC